MRPHHNADDVLELMTREGWQSSREAKALAQVIQEVRFGKSPWTEHNQRVAEEALRTIKAEGIERSKTGNRRAA